MLATASIICMCTIPLIFYAIASQVYMHAINLLMTDFKNKTLVL